MIGIPNLLMIHARLLTGYRSGILSVLNERYNTLKKLWLLPFLVWAGPVVGYPIHVYKVDEKSLKIQADLDDPLFYDSWSYIHAGNDGRYVNPTFYANMDGSPGLIVNKGQCQLEKVYPLEAFRKVEHEDHRKAVLSVLTSLNACTFAYTQTKPGNPSWWKLRLYVGLSGGIYYANLDLESGSVEPEPNQCTASIDAMDFGLIQPSSMPIKKSDLLVSCSRDAEISISTNHGRRFVDEASGTEIEFIDPPAFALSSCSKYCIVNIEGRMTKTPNNKGSYKWFVPVVIEYL